MTSVEFCSQLLSLEHSLLKFAYRLNLKRPDAKDLVQETYLKVLLNLEKYADDQNFKSWTFTVMKNTFVDNYRRSSRSSTYNDLTIDLFVLNQKELSGPDDPSSTYSVLEINQNIDQLEDRLRIPFQMFVDGFKYSEIAEELKIKIGTVKSRIFLSRKELMTKLNK